MVNKKIGLVGLGRWGSIWARVLKEEGVLAWVTDIDNSKANEYPNYFVPTLVALESDKNFVDGVIIATPPSEHFHLIYRFLEQEIPVLCEKPLTTTLEEAETVSSLAKEMKTPLLVGHTFLYSEPIRVFHDYINRIGDIKDISLYWLQNGTRSGLNMSALWNLGPHPFSILGTLMDWEYPDEIYSYKDVHRFIWEERDIRGKIVTSHDNPETVREIFARGEHGTVRCLPTENKVIVEGPNQRYTIDVQGQEPLKNELEFFLEVIDTYANSSSPFTGNDGKWIVKMLTEIEKYG